MHVGIKVIIPKRAMAEPRKMAQAIKNALDGAAKAAQVDFNVTAQTWQHKPAFTIDSPSDFSRVIGTDDEVYGYVNSGTRPHVIKPRNGKVLAFGSSFSPKTAPRVIGSGGGSKGGGTVFSRGVNHPGTDAREFDQAKAEKWTDLLPQTIQRAIDSALGE